MNFGFKWYKCGDNIAQYSLLYNIMNMKAKPIIIRNSYPIIAKLVGLIFIIVGGFFGWLTLSRILASEISNELIIFAIFALAFPIGGFSVLVSSSLVVIDPYENLVIVLQDFKLFKRIDEYALSEFHSVIYETDADGNHPKVILQGDAKQATVVFRRDHHEARRYGEKLAAILGMYFATR